MTPNEAIEAWLRNSLAWKRFGAALSGVGLLLAAALILFVTFWIIYSIIFVATFALFHVSRETRLWISAAGLVLLFISGAMDDRRSLETFSFPTGITHGKPVTVHVPFVGLGSTINPLAPDSMHSQIKMIASVVAFGPRLAVAAVRFFRQCWRLFRLDVEGCAAVLTALAAAEGRVPFPDLAAVIPKGHDVSGVLAQMRDIYGVRLLSSEPAGLSLLSSLREELNKVGRRGGKQKKRKAKSDAG